MPTRHEHEHRVTALELFFDLVFVFAFTQVTNLIADDPTWAGLGRGLLVLAALWWAWGSYAWLTNMLDPDEGGVRLAMFGSVAALFVASLAVPQAFADDAVVFGAAYLVVRTLNVVLFVVAAKGDDELLHAVRRFALTAFGGSSLILLAGFAEGELQAALWIGALAVDYGGALFVAGSGFRIHPAHFVERHGLIVIIALGESIISVGVGAAGQEIHLGVVAAAVLGIAVSASIWWTYFDWFTIAGEQLLANRSGAERAVLARDVFGYLHLPQIAGIVLLALGLKKTLEHVGADLGTIPAVALCGGSALYLLASPAIRMRVERRVSPGRLLAGLLLLAFIPAAASMPALAALAGVATLFVCLLVWEVLHYREQRSELRAVRVPAG